MRVFVECKEPKDKLTTFLEIEVNNLTGVEEIISFFTKYKLKGKIEVSWDNTDITADNDSEKARAEDW